MAGQNESGKSSVLEAISSFERNVANRENLNFQLENEENLTQEISVTYSDLDEDFYSELKDSLYKLVQSVGGVEFELLIDEVIDELELKKIKEYTLTKIFDFTDDVPKIIDQLSDDLFVRVTRCLKKRNLKTENGDGTYEVHLKDIIKPEDFKEEIFSLIWQSSMQILLFNDFLSVLPDRILLNDLNNDKISGIQAVQNIESLLNVSFEDIAAKSTPQKISTSQTESEIISADFQKDWQQKIYGDNKVNIKFFIENNDEGVKEISFFIETRDNEFLAPRRRSKGMIWFLSLWLELKAKEDSSNMLLLFDEPGLHLHVKANKDMLAVFHKLVAKGHQIIYSTHSPALIEVDNLQSIGLVVNSIVEGTTIEGLTSSKFNSSNKIDALQPISQAMGLEPLRDFSHFKQRNVIVEGLSDFWILKGMQKLLGRTSDYEFIPTVGIKDSKVLPLISFCIGYGFDWLLIMDGGENPKKLKKLLVETYFQNDSVYADSKVFLSDKDEIENLFNLNDISKIDSSVSIDKTKSPIENIGKRGKIMFSKTFYSKALDGSLSKSDLESSTSAEFEKIFDWIELKYKS